MSRPRLSLQTIDFTPMEFKAAEFTPAAAIAPGTLATAMAKGEERRKQATDRIGVYDNAVNQARELLHNDEETLAWYRDYSQKYKDAIDAAVQIGDYEGAFTTASQAATDFLSSKEYTTRARYNSEYGNWKKTLESTITDKDYIAFWEDKYKYKDSDLLDSNGNIIEGKSWDAPLPMGPINWQAEVAQAAAYVAESSTSSQSSRTTTRDYTSTTRGGGSSLASKDLDKIYENLVARFDTPEGRALLDENYERLKYDYNKYLDRLDKSEIGTQEYQDALYDLNSFLKGAGSKNNSFPTKQSWVEYHISKEYANVKNSAYTKKASSSEFVDVKKDPTLDPNNPNYSGPGSQQPPVPSPAPDTTPTTPGAPVENKLRPGNQVLDDLKNAFNGAPTSTAKQTIR